MVNKICCLLFSLCFLFIVLVPSLSANAEYNELNTKSSGYTDLTDYPDDYLYVSTSLPFDLYDNLNAIVYHCLPLNFIFSNGNVYIDTHTGVFYKMRSDYYDDKSIWSALRIIPFQTFTYDSSNRRILGDIVNFPLSITLDYTSNNMSSGVIYELLGGTNSISSIGFSNLVNSSTCFSAYMFKCSSSFLADGHLFDGFTIKAQGYADTSLDYSYANLVLQDICNYSSVFRIISVEDSYASGYNTGYASGETVGYDKGYAEGFKNGSNEVTDEIYDNGYNVGFDEGKEFGYNNGYSSGYNVGYNTGLDTSWEDLSPWQALVNGVDDFFDIELWGTISVGTILKIGFGLILLGFIIKIFLGG